eukprot:7344946-Pyramimonas_sp.AAC.1
MLAVAREASQLRLIGQLDKREAHRLRLRDLRLRLHNRGSSSTASESMRKPRDQVATAPTERP